MSGRLVAASCLVALACAVVPRAELANALASAAGTVFEAAPLILAIPLFPTRSRTLASLVGCGCRRSALPGALAPAAIALCWLTFGPVCALARAVAALVPLAFAAVRRRRESTPDRLRADLKLGTRDGERDSVRDSTRDGERAGERNGMRAGVGGGGQRARIQGRARWLTTWRVRLALALGRSAPDESPADPFAELIRLAGSSAVASLLAARIAPVVHGPVAAIAAGAILGYLAPCATAGVAMAAGFAPHAPMLAAAMLATCGVIRGSLFRAVESTHAQSPAPNAALRDTRLAAALLAGAFALLVARGPSGLVNPRLLPLVAFGAAAAVVYVARRRDGHRAALLVPAILLSALAFGSPQPQYRSDETTFATGFSGERVTFTGVAARNAAGTTVLVRAAITCCRIDARSIAAPLDRRLPIADGAWITATGHYRLHDGQAFLELDRWQRVAPPADPFTYS